jgi:hypothetical protein
MSRIRVSAWSRRFGDYGHRARYRHRSVTFGLQRNLQAVAFIYHIYVYTLMCTNAYHRIRQVFARLGWSTQA